MAHSLLLLLLGGAASATDAPQQVWLLSTRCVSGCGGADDAVRQFCYWRLGDDCDAEPADAQDFRAADDPALPTVVFIHGNNTNAAEAVMKGCFVYESIRAEAGGKAFRFVIWSWPADKLHHVRNRRTTRYHAQHCDVESCYLAAWLGQLRPGVKVCLTGHSFGPRIITGALHLLAGGELACQTLPAETVAAWAGGKRNPIRAVLMASAMDADWLAPGSCHGLALTLPDQVLVTCNGCDRVLRWYPHLWGRHGPQAMGFVGPCGVGPAENVEAIDVSCSVGKIHDWRNYSSSADVRCRWAHYTFLDDPPAAAATVPMLLQKTANSPRCDTQLVRTAAAIALACFAFL